MMRKYRVEVVKTYVGTVYIDDEDLDGDTAQKYCDELYNDGGLTDLVPDDGEVVDVTEIE